MTRLRAILSSRGGPPHDGPGGSTHRRPSGVRGRGIAGMAEVDFRWDGCRWARTDLRT